MAKAIEKSGNGAAQSNKAQRILGSALKAVAVAGVIVASLSGCASTPATQTAAANWCYSPGTDANCRPILEVGNWR